MFVRNIKDMNLKSFFLIILIAGSHFLLAQSVDVLKVTTHKLENGLTVFLNEDPTATKMFGAVMVKAGAVNESEDATGMAHYLEHLLFKGTTILGTSDYQKEKPLLDSIHVLYDQLAQELDRDQQLIIQKQINNLAVKSAKYGLPNEFDKLLKSIGGTDVNAFTSYDMTFYHNTFPSHETEKWLDLYSARFDNPVFRSFQSELEVVYEEKNRDMDGMENRIFEEINKANFPNLPYGKWSILGTVEHLKKPSLTKMKAFYEKHYVAKNMAIILTGNFKAKEVLPIITEKFKNLSAKAAPSLNLPELQPLAENLVKKIRVTPIKIEMLGWQTAPFNHKDRAALDVCERMLSNESETGLMDQLSENNEVMYTFGITEKFNHAGAFSIIAVPKPFIQSISNTDKKIEKVLNKLKNGDFTDELLNVSKYELSKQFQQEMEQIRGRGIAIGRAFSQGVSWEEYLAYPKKVNQVNKEEVLAVAQKYFGKKRAKIISRTGFPKKVKLDKPPFKAVSRTQKETSIYAKNFENIPSQPFQPKFLDFDNDVEKTMIYKNQSLTKVENPVNDLFYLTIRFKKGQLQHETIAVAVDLMNYAGAGNYSYSELKKAFSHIGCSYYFSSNNNNVTLNLEGTEEHLNAAIELTNLLLKQPKEDVVGFNLMLKTMKLDRKRERRDKPFLGGALFNYAQHQKESSFVIRPALKAIKKMNPSTLMATYQDIVENYKVDISYVGNALLDSVKNALEKKIDLFGNNKETPNKDRDRIKIPYDKVIVIHDKKAIQSQLYFYVPDHKRALSEYPRWKAFNSYFAGGFSGIMMQEIREYRSLAYGVQGGYVIPENSDGYFYAYIGCQSDKTIKAITVLDSLLKQMPRKPERLAALKKRLKLSTVSNSPNFKQLQQRISLYQNYGFKKDPQISAYQKYDTLTMDNVAQFYEKSIKGKPRVITIYGNKNKMDFEQLKQFGEVEILQLKEVIKF